jgi:tRNA-specific 2-thiouridylase
MYVIAIRPADRAVVIGPREELLGRGIVAREMNWLGDSPRGGDVVEVRVRHRAPLAAGEILRVESDQAEVALYEAITAITPGQSLVLYANERVLGGGLIEQARPLEGALPILAA